MVNQREHDRRADLRRQLRAGEELARGLAQRTPLWRVVHQPGAEHPAAFVNGAAALVIKGPWTPDLSVHLRALDSVFAGKLAEVLDRAAHHPEALPSDLVRALLQLVAHLDVPRDIPVASATSTTWSI